jgi:hypothetical protein
MRKQLLRLVLALSVMLTGSVVTAPPAHAEVACVIHITNPLFLAGDTTTVKSVATVTCTRTVDFIHVVSWITRTRADGVVFTSTAAGNLCSDKAQCQAKSTMTYVANPNDLWHGWGSATWAFSGYRQGRTQEIPTKRSPNCIDM